MGLFRTTVEYQASVITISYNTETNVLSCAGQENVFGLGGSFSIGRDLNRIVFCFGSVEETWIFEDIKLAVDVLFHIRQLLIEMAK